jgi:hypothetical protein
VTFDEVFTLLNYSYFKSGVVNVIVSLGRALISRMPPEAPKSHAMLLSSNIACGAANIPCVYAP